jgi:Tfp pilus assembly protein PilF
VERLTRDLRERPFDRRVYLERGAARLTAGDARGAIEDASRALATNLDPTDPAGHLLRARAWRVLGELEAAAGDLRRARVLASEGIHVLAAA